MFMGDAVDDAMVAAGMRPIPRPYAPPNERWWNDVSPQHTDKNPKMISAIAAAIRQTQFGTSWGIC